MTEINHHPCPWHGEACYFYDNSPGARLPVLSDEWCDEMQLSYGFDYREAYSEEFRKAWLERSHTNARTGDETQPKAQLSQQ